MIPVSLLVLLEIDVYAWTLEVSTRGHIKIRDGHFLELQRFALQLLKFETLHASMLQRQVQRYGAALQK